MNVLIQIFLRVIVGNTLLFKNIPFLGVTFLSRIDFVGIGSDVVVSWSSSPKIFYCNNTVSFRNLLDKLSITLEVSVSRMNRTPKHTAVIGKSKCISFVGSDFYRCSWFQLNAIAKFIVEKFMIELKLRVCFFTEMATRRIFLVFMDGDNTK